MAYYFIFDRNAIVVSDRIKKNIYDAIILEFNFVRSQTYFGALRINRAIFDSLPSANIIQVEGVTLIQLRGIIRQKNKEISQHAIDPDIDNGVGLDERNWLGLKGFPDTVKEDGAGETKDAGKQQTQKESEALADCAGSVHGLASQSGRSGFTREETATKKAVLGSSLNPNSYIENAAL